MNWDFSLDFDQFDQWEENKYRNILLENSHKNNFIGEVFYLNSLENVRFPKKSFKIALKNLSSSAYILKLFNFLGLLKLF